MLVEMDRQRASGLVGLVVVQHRHRDLQQEHTDHQRQHKPRQGSDRGGSASVDAMDQDSIIPVESRPSLTMPAREEKKDLTDSFCKRHVGVAILL
jgi:hypothetical protein